MKDFDKLSVEEQDKILDKRQKKKKVPTKIEIFSVNDLW